MIIQATLRNRSNHATCFIFARHQVDETVEWLSDYFLRSRLSKPELRSFGLYSSWAPYVSEVVSLWEHLIGSLISTQLGNCTRETVGSGKTMKGKRPKVSTC